jgi:hypothetical protein
MSNQNFHFERLNKEKALLLIVDHQLGLLQLVRDYSVSEFRNNVEAVSLLRKDAKHSADLTCSTPASESSSTYLSS